mmetsp:Transcript_23395/g.32783  ORF Transcript_23395/g.32783 Transcript_23395/m.32783 type:complete len:298 (+) Transcript_23395:209-1102(+)
MVMAPKTTATKPILYSAWFCPFAQRVWSCLNYFEVDYDLHESLGSGLDKSYAKLPELLKANPKGLVPTLVYPAVSSLEDEDKQKDIIQCESLDILLDLYEKHSNGGNDEDVLKELYQDANEWTKKICSPFYRVLMKPDKVGREEGWKEMTDGIVEFCDHLEWKATPAKTVTEEEEDGSATKKVRCVSYYQLSKSSSAKISNDEEEEEPTLVDFTVYPWINRLCVVEHYRGFKLMDKVPRDVSDKIYAWVDKMEALPAVQKTLADEKKMIAAYSRYADGTVESKVGDAVRQGKDVDSI